MGMPTSEMAQARESPSAAPSRAPANPSITFSATIRRTTPLERSPRARRVPNSPVRSYALMFTLFATLSTTMSRMTTWKNPNCRRYRATVLR